MKMASILVSILAMGLVAQAEENDKTTAAISSNEAILEGTQRATIERSSFGRDTSIWNVNLGLSQFDGGMNGDTMFKGNGLTVELQKRFADMFYAGASYTNYKTEFLSTNSDHPYDVTSTQSYVDMFALSLEAHVIRLALPGHSEFFVAVDFGAMIPGSAEQQREYFSASSYYGAGVGLNVSNQLGVRVDMQSNRELRAFNSFSLVGYY